MQQYDDIKQNIHLYNTWKTRQISTFHYQNQNHVILVIKSEYTGTTYINNQIQFKANTGLFKHRCTIALTLTEFR